jgi:hypothetical protein
MRSIVLALMLASIPVAALAGPPTPPVNVINPTNVVPLADLGPTTRVLCAAADSQCERLLDLGDQPVAVYQVHYTIVPGAELAPDGDQCWMRVLLRDDLTAAQEFVKFTLAANDLHGVTYVLPVPIGLQPVQNPVLRLVVGTNRVVEGACNAELKLYTRKN